MKNLLNNTLRLIFFAVIVRFIVLIVVGINIRNRHKLPISGPAIIVANHNSHLDTLVLISLLPLKLLPIIHPVAAADYFMKSKLFAWFSTKIIGIIPIMRKSHQSIDQVLMPCYDAIEKQQILILYPEGTRGEPEQLSSFKRGISYLAEKYPNVPIVPVYLHGLGKTLPKGELILVPFFCDIFVGDPILGTTDKEAMMSVLNERFADLAALGGFKPWE